MEWAIDVLKQVPALAVLAWLVHRGLESQKAATEMFVQRLQERDAVLRELEKNCHNVHKDAIATITKNTHVLLEVREALRGLGKP